MSNLSERILGQLETELPGVSQAQLARNISMDPSALSRALNGKRGLSGAEVVALAQQLKVSTDWLLMGEEPFPALVAARHGYDGGGYSGELPEGSARAISGVVTAYEQAGELPSWPVERDVPQDPSDARRLLGEACGDEWQRNFAEAVERAFGIDVVKLPLPGHAGVSLKLPNATVIVVPVEAFWGRQNFTIAHELWHVAHSHFTPLAEGVQPDGESAANAFAAELLMPAEEMRGRDWAALDDGELAAWLWDNGVSFDALKRRLTSLGLALPPFDGAPMTLLRDHIPAANVFDDPVTKRRRAAATRRFPARLHARHEELEKYPATLSWMLGAPFAPDDNDEKRPVNRASHLAALLGRAMA